MFGSAATWETGTGLLRHPQEISCRKKSGALPGENPPEACGVKQKEDRWMRMHTMHGEDGYPNRTTDFSNEIMTVSEMNCVRETKFAETAM